MRIDDVAGFLDEFAPPRLAESWDNVGLLVGDRQKPVSRIMTCLTVTPASAGEAIKERADLVVTHHPLPFRPLKRLTSDTLDGRLLLDLITGGIAIYSPHTAFDSTREGINQRLAVGLGIGESNVLVPAVTGDLGVGRWGKLAWPMSLTDLAQQVKRFLKIDHVQLVGAPDQLVSRVAVACGSAGELLPAALEAGCDAMVTGEMRFHGCLEAEASGIGLILAGHFASERFGVEELARVLAKRFAGLKVWASDRERDPLWWA